jgi:hypothetical protein
MNVRVIDNGSSDRSKVKALGAGAEVIDESRGGCSQSCWQGLQAIPAEVDFFEIS